MSWQQRNVPFKFQLGDWTVFSYALFMQVRQVSLKGAPAPVDTPQPPTDPISLGSQGFVIRSLPVSARQPVLRRSGAYLCYVPSQYPHYYIDLRSSFDQYKAKFSSKTRSTLSRKVSKYTQHGGGALRWRPYTQRDDMGEFFRHARAVSAKTYQEKLLDAGLPDSDEFLQEMTALAARDQVRAYVLFDGEKPVSYLYCPVEDDVLIYAYLGYDPDYLKLSVGTVLQWVALESLFDEGRFAIFDFTEGQSEHKRLFATHDVQAANVFFVRATFRNSMLIRFHYLFAQLSAALGRLLEKTGLKARVKRLLRFGARLA